MKSPIPSSSSVGTPSVLLYGVGPISPEEFVAFERLLVALEARILRKLFICIQ